MIQYFPITHAILDDKQAGDLSVLRPEKGIMKVRIRKGAVLPTNDYRYIAGYHAIDLSPQDYGLLISK